MKNTNSFQINGTVNKSNRVKGFPWDFFLITFGISWLIWLPGVLDALNLIDFHLTNSIYSMLNLFGGFAPTITCFLLLIIRNKKDEIKALFKSLIEFRNIGKIWWIPLLLLYPLIELIAFLINMISGGTVSVSFLLSQPWLIPIYFLGSLLPFTNAFREEFGWRGYALNRIQNKWNALFSSILLGLIWGFWHLPLYFFPTSQKIYGYIPFWAFMIEAIIISCLMTWIFNNTKSSMLSAILFHTIVNLSGLIFANYLTEYSLYFSLILKILVSVIIILIFGYKKMVRPSQNLTNDY